MYFLIAASEEPSFSPSAAMAPATRSAVDFWGVAGLATAATFFAFGLLVRRAAGDLDLDAPLRTLEPDLALLAERPLEPALPLALPAAAFLALATAAPEAVVTILISFANASLPKTDRRLLEMLLLLLLLLLALSPSLILTGVEERVFC